MAVLFLGAFDKNSLAEHTEIAGVGDDRTDSRVRNAPRIEFEVQKILSQRRGI